MAATTEAEVSTTLPPFDPELRLATLLVPELPKEAAVRVLCGEDGAPVVVLDSFLEASECARLVDELGPQLPTSDTKVNFLRRRQQANIVDPGLTATLWARLLAARALSPELGGLLDGYTAPDADEYPARLGGTWQVDHLRQRTLAARYTADDFFGAHFDKRVEEPPHLSHATLLIYLNQHGVDFEGGTTNILEFGCKLHQSTVDGKERFLAGDEGVLLRLRPKVGTALIFLQDVVWHEGGVVTDGAKFLLRTDIMFRRAAAEAESSFVENGGELPSVPVPHAGAAASEEIQPVEKAGENPSAPLTEAEAIGTGESPLESPS